MMRLHEERLGRLARTEAVLSARFGRGCFRAISALIAAGVLFVAPHQAAADPQVCTGLPAENNPALSGQYLPCPPQHAIFAVDDVGGEHKAGPGRYVPVSAACCPLPADDILTDDHLYGVMDRCPEGFVVTGATGNHCVDLCEVRCTRVNSKKYRLAPERGAAYWNSVGALVRGGGGEASKISLAEIPSAIRKGVLRRVSRVLGSEAAGSYRRRADEDGCVGIPFGSMLVAKNGKYCEHQRFRQLLLLDGTPVRMFPDCDTPNPPPAVAAECSKLLIEVVSQEEK